MMVMTISMKTLLKITEISIRHINHFFYFTCDFFMWASILIALKQSRLVKRPYRVHVKLRYTLDLSLKLKPLV